DAETPGIRDDGCRRPQAEHRVVVEGVVDERPVVDGLGTLAPEVVDQVLLEVEARVVGAQVDAHGGQCSSRDPRPVSLVYSPAMPRRLGPAFLALAVTLSLLAGCGGGTSSAPEAG